MAPLGPDLRQQALEAKAAASKARMEVGARARSAPPRASLARAVVPPPAAVDSVERVGCRPVFAVLCYPVIALGESYTHRGSQRNLLGANPDPQLLASLSSEKRVTKQTPPTFLWHTHADRGVPAENSVQFFLALRRAGVPASLHIFFVVRGSPAFDLPTRMENRLIPHIRSHFRVEQPLRRCHFLQRFF